MTEPAILRVARQPYGTFGRTFHCRSNSQTFSWQRPHDVHARRTQRGNQCGSACCPQERGHRDGEHQRVVSPQLEQLALNIPAAGIRGGHTGRQAGQNHQRHLARNETHDEAAAGGGQTLEHDQRPLEAAAQGGLPTIAGLERERLPEKGFAHFGKPAEVALRELRVLPLPVEHLHRRFRLRRRHSRLQAREWIEPHRPLIVEPRVRRRDRRLHRNRHEDLGRGADISAFEACCSSARFAMPTTSISAMGSIRRWLPTSISMCVGIHRKRGRRFTGRFWSD
jgi:hypothetical protein